MEGIETNTWVIFGEEGPSALLGAYTLEGDFLAVDPYNPTVGADDGGVEVAIQQRIQDLALEVGLPPTWRTNLHCHCKRSVAIPIR